MKIPETLRFICDVIIPALDNEDIDLYYKESLQRTVEIYLTYCTYDIDETNIVPVMEYLNKLMKVENEKIRQSAEYAFRRIVALYIKK